MNYKYISLILSIINFSIIHCNEEERQQTIIKQYYALSADDKKTLGKNFEKRLLIRNDADRAVKVWYEIYDHTQNKFIEQDPFILNPGKSKDLGQLLLIRNVRFRSQKGISTTEHQLKDEGTEEIHFLSTQEFSHDKDHLIRLNYSKAQGTLLPKWWYMGGAPAPEI